MQDQKLIIEAGGTESQYWKDIWRYRELFYFLAWRDIRVRYKQTMIGIAWALILPFLTMMAILGGESNLYLRGFAVSLGLVAVWLASGIWYFRKTERTFADVI